MIKYTKPLYNPPSKGNTWTYYNENCPEEYKTILHHYVAGTTSCEHLCTLYYVGNKYALIKHPGGMGWAGIGTYKYFSPWIVRLEIGKDRNSAECSVVWDVGDNGRTNKKVIQKLIDDLIEYEHAQTFLNGISELSKDE
jgi:hypothetical protein